jgi:uncharacterized protein with FMN-binding domain
MRKTAAAVLGATALALPNANAWAAASKPAVVPKKRVVVATRVFTGTLGFADRWGDVQVAITVRKTTTTVLKTKRRTVTRRILSVAVPVFPNHTDRSVFINQQALPLLIQETIQAQGSGVDMISGATATSIGFQQSLQSAILAAKAW